MHAEKIRSADLTGVCRLPKIEGLPRRVAVRLLVGVRPLLENSTACQKSMPIFTSSAGCVGAAVMVVLGCLVAIPLVEMDGLFASHLYSQITGPAFRVVFVFADVGACALRSGLSGCGAVFDINGEFDPGSGRTLT